MSGFRMIFVALSCTVLLQSNFNSAQSYSNHTCLGRTYAANSTFQANLYALLSSIAVNATPNDYIFSRKTVGEEDASKVYALFQCRGDYTSEDCKKFAVEATDDIKTRCPDKKEAIIFYDECWLHYSDRSLSTVQFEPTSRRFLTVRKGTDPSGNYGVYLPQITPKLKKLMEQLVVKAVSVSANLFEADSVDVSNYQKMYGLVQCIQDLPKTDCSRCLKRAVAEFQIINNIISQGLVFKPSCIAMFGGNQFYLLAAPPPLPAPPPPPGRGKKSSQNVVIIVVPTAIIVLLLSMIPISILLRRKKGSQMVKEDKVLLNPVQSLQFDFSTVGAATGNFCDANKLGEGGFGGVYKGTLHGGREIAVKRLARNSGQGGEEFKNEVALLSKLEHRNLVKLLGFCLEGDEKLLIYEFVANASLDRYIFDPENVTSLNWEARYKIIQGIARGLLYLHEDSPYMIIHRDIKASNILLDEKMNPKISDFGMARLFMVDQTQGSTNRIVGTFGYMSPEYATFGHFSVKSDVFSFGVVVLEIISGRKNTRYYGSQCDEYLLGDAWKHLFEGSSLELVEPLLGETYSPTEVIRCIHVALLCVQEDVAKRPTMASVVVMLNRNNVTLPLPSAPGFSLSSAAKSDMISEEHETNKKYSLQTSLADQSTTSSTLPSINEVSITELYPR